MPASSSPGFAGTPPMSDQSVLAMARRRGGAGSPTRLRAPEPRPSCPARHGSGGSPRWGSPWPTAVPTAPSPRTGLASPNGPAGDTSIGVEPGLDAISAGSRAARRTDPGEPLAQADSTQPGPPGPLAAKPDARLDDAGPRSRVGARRPRPPVRLVRSGEAGATGVPERRPYRGRTAPWAIFACTVPPGKVHVDGVDGVFGTHTVYAHDAKASRDCLGSKVCGLRSRSRSGWARPHR